MQPYKRNSLYRYQWLRRLRYGRGHGIHSPKGYAVVQSVVRPQHEYYRSEVLKAIDADSGVGGLWFRCIARLAPRTQLYALEDLSRDEYYRKVGRLADGRSGQYLFDSTSEVSDAGLITDCASTTQSFIENGGGWILMINIRQTAGQERKFRDLLDKMERGIVIDLYDCALLFDQNDDLYIYRSSL